MLLLFFLIKKHIFIVNCNVFLFQFYISFSALVLHFLVILVSSHLI